MYNYWTVEKYEEATWEADFPFDGTRVNVLKMLDFAERLLALGYQYEVYCIHDASKEFSAQEASYKLYLDYISKLAVTEQEFPYFDYFSYNAIAPNLITSSKICYYDNAKMISTHVNDVSALFKRLYLQEKQEPLRALVRPRPPLVISGHSVNLNRDEKFFTKYITLEIETYTDIWLPKVRGLREKITAYEEDDMYDNRELALCHTLRLNSFLQDARTLVLEYGGSWRLLADDIGYDVIKNQLTDTGIKL